MRFIELAQLIYFNQQLMKSQWWERQKIEEHRHKNLKVTLKYAYEHVPFYRTRFEQNSISPENIHTLSDLEHIPILEKADLQQAKTAELVSDESKLSKCRKLTTSGSTGRPLSLYFSSREFTLLHRASYSRFQRQYGRKLRDTVIYFGMGSSLHLGKTSFLSKILPHQFIPVDSFLPIDEQVKLLLDTAPTVITGYTKSIEFIAQAVIERNITSIRPHLVYTGAEMLSHRTRTLVKEAFGVELYDTYNSIEFGSIAWECPGKSKLYHINDDLFVVEIIGQNGERVEPGIPGEVVITSLFSRTQPLIRYRLGDIAVLSESVCPCGRGLRTLSRIEGRKAEALLLPDGRQITTLYFTGILRNFDGIKQFQVVQEGPNQLRLRIVRVHKDYDVEEARQQLERALKYFKVEIEYLDSLDLSKTGKYRIFIPMEEHRH